MTVRRQSTLTRRDPFADFPQLSGWPFQPLVRRRGVASNAGASANRWTPAVEIREDSEAYRVSLEIPGTPLDGIQIESHDSVLTIKGEKKATEVAEGESCQLAERSYGSFSRTFRIPKDSDEEKIRASYINGVLEVEIPRLEPTTPTTIPIES